LQSNKHNPLSIGKSIFTIFTKAWFIEGLFYSTCIAFLWTNEEPSKLNTLFVAWTAYVLVVLVLFYSVKSGLILNPNRWIRVYFVMSLLMLLVCNFVWLQGSVPRTTGPAFDPIRFDAYAVTLAESGMDSQYVTFQNYTGTIWYAGFIYWIFGISKFYVALFNGALVFISCILFTSTIGRIEGNPFRWQWLCFGMLLPDFIYHSTNVSKEPLSVFLVALGIWVAAKGITRKKSLRSILLLLIMIAILGLAVRAAITVIILTIAIIWLWRSVNITKKIGIFIFILGIFIWGQVVTNFVTEHTGSMKLDFKERLTTLINPDNRMRKKIDYPKTGSWNVIMESAPVYLMPLTLPAKGFFMMIAPMPLWELHLVKITDDIIFKRNYDSSELRRLFPKFTAWLFVFSLPFLLAALLDTYRLNRRLWFLFPFTFTVLICLMGFTVYGMIEPRYRPMLLLFWLVTAGIGCYYGKPKRYIIPVIYIFVLGGIIYLLPKLY
jgi:hypothetical protein